MGWIWACVAGISILISAVLGNGQLLAAAVPQGAQEGIRVSVAMAGSVCLWSGVGKLAEKSGITSWLSRFLKPILSRVFPRIRQDPILAEHIAANVCANFLGLGNAATPMGIQAAKRMVSKTNPEIATNELCRLVVLNTASIQCIPANVAALRAGLGCMTPFDILPAVWITSICSAGAGLIAAWCMGRIWKHV